jgi:hypothetical protein
MLFIINVLLRKITDAIIYKRGVVSNVNYYKKRLKKNDNVNNNLLDDETLNDENGDDDDEYEVME